MPQEMDYSRYYQNWHDESATHFEAMGQLDYKTLTPFLPANRDAKILDFGCGMGFALGGLKAAGYTCLIGLDSDRSQADKAQARGLEVRLVKPNDTVALLDEWKGTFDCIYSLDVLEHIDKNAVPDLLVAIRCALKPGGRFICRVPNCDSVIASRYRYDDWTHLWQGGVHSLDFILWNAGFDEIRILGESDTKMPKRHLMMLIRWTLRRIFRGLHYLTLVSELGVREAKRTPLSPNIWGIGMAPKLSDEDVAAGRTGD